MASVADKSKETVATPKHISWADFQKRYLRREDKYKYEWLNGIVEKTERTMDTSQFYILDNLDNLFYDLKFQGKIDGKLIPEGDIFFKQNHRRPDICYLNADQMALTAHGENQVPQFVIEIISTNDGMNRTYRKMRDYWQAGVQVVWHILPLLEEVHVYRGRNMTVCREDDLCSAAPVLVDFELPVHEIFKKPALPKEHPNT